MRKFYFICLGTLVVCLWSGLAAAATFQLAGGQTVSGTPASPNEKGTLLKLDDGTYSERIAWDKFSQDDLKTLAASNPRIAAYVQQLIEPSEEEKKAVEKAAIVVKDDFERLDPERAKERLNPNHTKPSLVKALFTSGVGVVSLLLIYLANVYAGYEVSIFRARSPALVCGVAAVAPLVGPIIFLCLPTLVEDKSEIVQEPAREKESYHVGDVPPESEVADSLSLHAQEAALAAVRPPTRTFARGQFTFNRRFFETQFPGFFTVVRREADKDLILVFKSARGEHIVQRITRVGANELHLQVQRGHASEEVMIPFMEIQEVVLRHKDT